MLNDLKIPLDYFQTHKDKLLDFYFNLLKIPSISTEAKHQKDCHKAAEFVASFLKPMGFDVQIHEENRNYLVYAELISSKDHPTLMFYGHTDVQPCDPLDLWDQEPFEPYVKEGRVFARGAQDNKGQLSYTLLAIKAYLDIHGPLKHFNIKLVIEGEEESGSKGTESILKQLGSKLKADELYVVDFDAKSEQVPSILLGMRGLCAFEVHLTNAFTDLHSGMYGGVVYNPLRALSELMASCFNHDGRLAFEGAYSGLKQLSAHDLNHIDFTFNKEHIVKTTGVHAFCIPVNTDPRQANWLLPTFEINGLYGGYQGEGVKTVLPKEAIAKISCRLGPGQNPHQFIEACKNHLASKLPEGFKMEFKVHQAASGFYTSLQNSSVQKAKASFEAVFQHKALIGLTGASVPIVGLLSQLSTHNVALIGVGLDSDNIHAPNEHFSLSRFEKGFLSIFNILKST